MGSRPLANDLSYCGRYGISSAIVFLLVIAKFFFCEPEFFFDIFQIAIFVGTCFPKNQIPKRFVNLVLILIDSFLPGFRRQFVFRPPAGGDRIIFFGIGNCSWYNPEFLWLGPFWNFNGLFSTSSCRFSPIRQLFWNAVQLKSQFGGRFINQINSLYQAPGRSDIYLCDNSAAATKASSWYCHLLVNFVLILYATRMDIVLFYGWFFDHLRAEISGRVLYRFQNTSGIHPALSARSCEYLHVQAQVWEYWRHR